MGKIVKYEYKRDRVYDLENEMIRCKLFHSIRLLNITRFQGYSYGFHLISKAVKEDNSLFQEYTKSDHRKKIIESLETIEAFDNTFSFKLELFEKAYLDLYQAFEYFILDCYRSIFCCYPIILRVYNRSLNSKFNLSEKTFLYNNEELINEILDETLDKLSRSKTILQQIEMLNRLPFKIMIAENIKQQIIEFTKNRNLLIHNDGRISKTYLQQLEENEIVHNYVLGQSIIRDYLSQVPLSKYKELVDINVEYITTEITSSKIELENIYKELK